MNDSIGHLQCPLQSQHHQPVARRIPKFVQHLLVDRPHSGWVVEATLHSELAGAPTHIVHTCFTSRTARQVLPVGVEELIELRCPLLLRVQHIHA